MGPRMKGSLPAASSVASFFKQTSVSLPKHAWVAWKEICVSLVPPRASARHSGEGPLRHDHSRNVSKFPLDFPVWWGRGNLDTGSDNCNYFSKLPSARRHRVLFPSLCLCRRYSFTFYSNEANLHFESVWLFQFYSWTFILASQNSCCDPF